MDFGGGYSVAPIDVPLSYPASLPSSLTTTKVLTESTTVTSYTTSTISLYSPYNRKDIISAIEGLAECSQTILFECLADSKCKPADFACICAALKALTIEAKIGKTCSPTDKAHYIAFQSDVCSGDYPTQPPVSPSSIVVMPSSSKPMPTLVYPVYNTTTVTKNDTTTTLPVKITSTQTVQITSMDAAGSPTTIQTVIPPVGYPTGPAAPVPSEYTGSAGSMKMAALAGAVGFLGLVFAAL